MFEASAVVLSSMTHFVHVNSELQSMVNESVPQTNYSELWSWTLWTCTSSTHPQTVFHQPLKCSLRLQVHFRVDNFFAEWTKCCVYTWFRSAIWLVPPEPRQQKSTTFPADVTRLSQPPGGVFEKRSLRTRLGRGGWSSSPPQILSSSYYVYKQLKKKGCPKFRKAREKKQLSGYKQCYTYKDQKCPNLWIQLSLCATNSIVEAKPPPNF